MDKQRLLLRYILPLAFGIGTFIFIIVKALAVQVTTDEAYTLTILTKETVWNLVSYKSSYTNNHIMNSLLCKLSFSIFGMNQLAGRLPNIMSFVLYFWFVWQFSRRFFTDDFVGFMFVCVMLGNPYLIEFFSLARGYGMSFALMMASIYYAARHVIENKRGTMRISLLFAILAVYAQFALLHFYFGLNILIFAFSIQRFIKTKQTALFNDRVQKLLRGIGFQILAATILGLLVAAPFLAILKDNQISYYGSKNIWDDSIVSLISRSIYRQGYFSSQTVVVFKNLMIVLFLLSIINFVQKIREKPVVLSRKNKSKDPSVFSFVLMLSVFGIITLQFYVLGTQYVVDRTCLFLYPIVALNMPTVATFIGNKKQWAKRFVAIVFSVFCIWHISRSSHLDHFSEWWFDKNTKDVLEIMKTEYQKMQVKRPIKLNTHCNMQPSFDYYHKEQHLDWLVEPFGWSNKVDTTNTYDYYYDLNDEWDALKTRYDTLKSYDGGEFLLLKKK